MTDFKVCGACGWHILPPPSTHNCHVKEGAAASALAAALTGIKTTQLGYGARCITAEIDDDFSVTLGVHANATFNVDRFWLLDYDMTVEDASGLVRALDQWRRDCLVRRQRADGQREFFHWYRDAHTELHKAWTADVGSLTYDKARWKRREEELNTEARKRAATHGIEPPYLRPE